MALGLYYWTKPVYNYVALKEYYIISAALPKYIFYVLLTTDIVTKLFEPLIVT